MPAAVVHPKCQSRICLSTRLRAPQPFSFAFRYKRLAIAEDFQFSTAVDADTEVVKIIFITTVTFSAGEQRHIRLACCTFEPELKRHIHLIRYRYSASSIYRQIIRAMESNRFTTRQHQPITEYAGMT